MGFSGSRARIASLASAWLSRWSSRRAPRRRRRTSRSRPRSAPPSTCCRAPARSRATIRYEARTYRMAGWEGPDYERYPGACQRLRFSFGPIAVKPGQNDVLVEPVKIEKPMRDGYITRFEPNLVFPDGTVPPIEQVHLHHGTWLSAAGLRPRPVLRRRRGEDRGPVPDRLRDAGQGDRHLAAALHGPLGDPEADGASTSPTTSTSSRRPRRRTSGSSPRIRSGSTCARPATRSSTRSATTAKGGECTWPKEECAAFNPWGNTEVGQGAPGNGIGEDLELPELGESFGAIENFTGGTLIGIGGHLHPGGLQNEIDLVRDGKAKRIYTGRAAYWKRKPGKPKAGRPADLLGLLDAGDRRPVLGSAGEAW